MNIFHHSFFLPLFGTSPALSPATTAYLLRHRIMSNADPLFRQAGSSAPSSPSSPSSLSSPPNSDEYPRLDRCFSNNRTDSRTGMPPNHHDHGRLRGPAAAPAALARAPVREINGVSAADAAPRQDGASTEQQLSATSETTLPRLQPLPATSQPPPPFRWW
ncbi:uncharacterized protein THITE_2108094 [Thermothielavioides terrestris NRRL 8126]|uniref:Uncharacterized protein n=1 Tax=Thermothielavioides terrestris (strain ATCC 38088 / NRRL 8126) TaxID=578455 RepID=G2QXG3_THETT|nr:uncharacterized protein THITE_2108094 [Thermothielavioides terrestris NRRL 8126]AEO63186.1 hypothetical protein THITE_2108094 [Thermothielavioides terrestris NRRL 8126]